MTEDGHFLCLVYGNIDDLEALKKTLKNTQLPHGHISPKEFKILDICHHQEDRDACLDIIKKYHSVEYFLKGKMKIEDIMKVIKTFVPIEYKEVPLPDSKDLPKNNPKMIILGERDYG